MLGKVGVKDLVEILDGQFLNSVFSEKFPQGLSIDTRKLKKGDLFFALRGEKVDGHQFVEEAFALGASAVVIDNASVIDSTRQNDVIVVDSVIDSLQKLAIWHREKWGGKVIAITGSAGKTSTKNLISSVLSQKYRVSCSPLSYNNYLGVPLSLLQIKEDDDFSVLELGTNSSGEIAFLCDLASPDFGVITHIGTAHIGLLGSREAIAKEKSALPKSLSSSGAFFLPFDCKYFSLLAEKTSAEVISVGRKDTFAWAEEVKVFSEFSQFFLCFQERREEVQIRFLGKHMVGNAVLAAAIGQFFNLNIKQVVKGLSSAICPSSRMQAFRSCQGEFLVFDDGYNASPDSVKEAILFLADLDSSPMAKKWFIFGGMGELGKQEKEEHYRLGLLAAEKGLNSVLLGKNKEKDFTSGFSESEKSQDLIIKCFSHRKNLIDWLLKNVSKGDFVLCKGQRISQMDKVALALVEN